MRERERGDGAKIEKFFRATIPRLLFAVGCCKIWQNVVGWNESLSLFMQTVSLPIGKNDEIWNFFCIYLPNYLPACLSLKMYSQVGMRFFWRNYFFDILVSLDSVKVSYRTRTTKWLWTIGIEKRKREIKTKNEIFILDDDNVVVELRHLPKDFFVNWMLSGHFVLGQNIGGFIRHEFVWPQTLAVFPLGSQVFAPTEWGLRLDRMLDHRAGPTNGMIGGDNSQTRLPWGVQMKQLTWL